MPSASHCLADRVPTMVLRGRPVADTAGRPHGTINQDVIDHSRLFCRASAAEGARESHLTQVGRGFTLKPLSRALCSAASGVMKTR